MDKSWDILDICGSISSSKDPCRASSPECKLPEELVEMIISRIPFPFIFRSRCLSKGWLSRLSIPYDTSHRNFQRQVILASGDWPTFCPVFVVDGTILGYDRVTQKWLKMKMHPFSSKSVVSSIASQRLNVHPVPVVLFAGALICHIVEVGHGCQVTVSNVVTGSTRYLPGPPISPQARGHIGVIGEAKMFHARSSGYEVLLVHTLINEHAEETPAYSLFLYVQLYSSDTGTWLEKSVFFDPLMPYEQCIYLVKCSPCSDGYIYILFFHERSALREYLLEVVEHDWENEVENSSLSLWSYGLYSGRWTKYKLDLNILRDYDIMLADQVSCSVLKCGSRILLIDIKGGNSRTYEGRTSTSSIQVRVSQLDGQTEELEVVSESPLIQVPSLIGMTTMRRATRFVSDDQHVYIYFMMSMELSVQVYHVEDSHWSTLPFPPGSVRSLCRATTWVQSAFSPGWFTFSIV